MKAFEKHLYHCCCFAFFFKKCPFSFILFFFPLFPSAATDPALMDPALLKKLRSNRVVALSRLEEVIDKYAVEQDMVDKEKLRMDKEVKEET